jgi:hypothetical protein
MLSLWAYESFSPYEQGQEWMDVSLAEKKWGAVPFSPEKFRTGSMKVRASMASSLIQTKVFIGKTPAQVRNALGAYTGYFFSDQVPAYQLDDGWRRNSNTWNLVFIPALNGKIKEVRIHKNCCSDVIWKERGLPAPTD